MGSAPPVQSPPQEADIRCWARSGDRYTGLAFHRLAVEAVRTLRDGFEEEYLRGVSLRAVGPLLIGTEAG